MKKIMQFSLVATILVLCLASCKKNNLVIDRDTVLTPPAAAEFLLTSFSKDYYIRSTVGSYYALPVGVTSVAQVDRTISFTYTSSTGAVAGTHYTAPASLTIKAGQALDSLRITGIYAPYNGTSRVDSLKIKIIDGSIAKFIGKDSVVLAMRQYCDVVLTNLGGDYPDTQEFSYSATTGAYTQTYGLPIAAYSVPATVNNLVQTTATSASGTFGNLYDAGWLDVTFTMDWTNDANFKVTIPLQNTGDPTIDVRTSLTKPSTFSSCDRTFTLVCDLINPATGAITSANYKFFLK